MAEWLKLDHALFQIVVAFCQGLCGLDIFVESPSQRTGTGDHTLSGELAMRPFTTCLRFLMFFFINLDLEQIKSNQNCWGKPGYSVMWWCSKWIGVVIIYDFFLKQAKLVAVHWSSSSLINIMQSGSTVCIAFSVYHNDLMLLYLSTEESCWSRS